MYIKRMKRKTTKTVYSLPEETTEALHDQSVKFTCNEPAEGAGMVRTQIYLNRREHEFLQAEAARCGESMAAVIRGLITNRMRVPEDAWANNPILEATPEDPSWEGHPDGAVNHDHYIYGSPKKQVKMGGRWVEDKPLSEDYYAPTNSADAIPGVEPQRRRK